MSLKFIGDGRLVSILVGPLPELFIEDATLLINLDYWSATVVDDHSALLISCKEILLGEILIPGFPPRQCFFMSNGDMWIDDSILGTDVSVSVRIVRLFD